MPAMSSQHGHTRTAAATPASAADGASRRPDVAHVTQGKCDDAGVTTWPFTAAETVDMRLERVALAVLENFHARNAWLRRNRMLEVSQGLAGDPQRFSAGRALAEAMEWLFNRGLLAHDDDDNKTFVTRLGLLTLAAGPDRMRATEQLGLELHPTLATSRQQFERARWNRRCTERCARSRSASGMPHRCLLSRSAPT